MVNRRSKEGGRNFGRGLQRTPGNKSQLSYMVSKEIEELQECSFTPNLEATERLNRSVELYRDKSPRYEALYALHEHKIRQKRTKAKVLEDQEIENCTFVPKTNHSSAVPKRYERIVNSERKYLKKNRKLRKKSLTPDMTARVLDGHSESDGPYVKLYEDYNRYQEKKRWKEYKLRQERMETCTFTPSKISKLEFQYSEQFKNPDDRLYNEYFEQKQRKFKAK